MTSENLKLFYLAKFRFIIPQITGLTLGIILRSNVKPVEKMDVFGALKVLKFYFPDIFK